MKLVLSHDLSASGVTPEMLAAALAPVAAQLPRWLAGDSDAARAMLTESTREDNLSEIEAQGVRLREIFSDLVVVGMGGSSMSAEALTSLHPKSSLRLHVMDAIDPHEIPLLLQQLPLPTTCFLIVSKTGQTLETLALMAVCQQAVAAAGLSPARHLKVLTTPDGNPMHAWAEREGLEQFAHAPHLGGRFSMLSNVGLIPAAAMGIDIRALRAGAREVLSLHATGHGPAVEAAAMHAVLARRGIATHVLTHYSDRWGGLAQWFRQCWPESLGKQGFGAQAVVSRGVTDQHSQLQMFIEGRNDKLFTAITIDHEGMGATLAMPNVADARFQALQGKTLGDVCAAEQHATYATLVAAGRPLRRIHAREFSPYSFGALAMHWMIEIMLTAALVGINAFDQPAVEEGKRRTLAHLRGE
jgi:glucose-6-phosphate isomerase